MLHFKQGGKLAKVPVELAKARGMGIDRIDFHCNNEFQHTLKPPFMVKIMTIPNDLERKARQALIACLQDIPFLEAEISDDQGGDFVVSVNLGDKEQTILAEFKNNGEPRYARQAVNQLLRYMQKSPAAYSVFIAPYISPQAAKICREANIGYVDFAGNCFLSFGQVFIQREGKPNPYAQKRKLRSLYSPKAERILRVMLAVGPKGWKVVELAGEAGVSLGLVSNVKKLLADREWVDYQNVGFSLVEPFSLLEEWSQNYTYRRNQINGFYSMLSVPDFENRLGEICQQQGIQYGLTGFSGAARLAPMVRYQQVMAYVGGDIEELVELLGVKPVTSGANVLLLAPYDEGVFYGSQEMDGLTLVSPIQIYLDLMGYRGRGEEAARTLLDEVIRKQW